MISSRPNARLWMKKWNPVIGLETDDVIPIRHQRISFVVVDDDGLLMPQGYKNEREFFIDEKTTFFL